MSSFWKQRKVLVTGGTGFVGSWAIDALVAAGADVSVAVRPATRAHGLRQEVEPIVCDLRDAHDCLRACHAKQVVFSFAHGDGSADFKRRQPASLFRQNMSISLNLLEAAAHQGVERVLITSSAEVYSPDVPPPTLEDSAFEHLERVMGDGYAWSKRVTEVAARLYSRQYGFRLAIARPSNLYGPGDSYDESRGRVIPMFIRRIESGQPVVIWGDGEQLRSFLYVEDFVRGTLDLVESYSEGEPVNFASPEHVTIRDLALRIATIAGRVVDIRCELDKPAGAPRRMLDITRARQSIGFEPRVKLDEGLRRTILAYRAFRAPLATHA
jgi:nucleoside-diphosphate-sugar epimerase